MTLNAFERRCLNQDASAPPEENEISAWLRMMFGVALAAGRIVRELKLGPLRDAVTFKGDGSPVTVQERAIEDLLREHVTAAGLRATVVGEESGGELPSRGYAVAIDPVDGTWSLINCSETHSVCLALFLDQNPIAGLVLNPSTGEIAYAAEGHRTRLVQVSAFGAADGGCDLPVNRIELENVLVNVHPSPGAADLVARLHESWHRRDVRLVRSVGGSPSWALADAAKGCFVYVNLWANRPADAYDLAPGILLVRGAGGEVVDLDGNPIESVGHMGPLVAAVDDDARWRVLDIARDALRE